VRNDLVMPARVALVLCTLLVLAWTGVLVRDHYVRQSAAEPLLFETSLSEADFDRHMERLDDSRFLNPDSSVELARAEYYLFRGRPREAASVAERLVRAEPENADAWRLLWRAALETDPRRAAQAVERLRELNPLAKL
jgi:predicted Zn-dependent protease